MDKMITRYILSDPLFYSRYAGNRAIVDPRSTRTQIKGTITDSTGDSPLINVQIRVLKNETVVTTGGRGRYMIRPLKPGIYSLKITKEGYKEKIVTDLHVKLGQITTCNAALSKVANELPSARQP